MLVNAVVIAERYPRESEQKSSKLCETIVELACMTGSAVVEGVGEELLDDEFEKVAREVLESEVEG